MTRNAVETRLRRLNVILATPEINFNHWLAAYREMQQLGATWNRSYAGRFEPNL